MQGSGHLEGLSEEGRYRLLVDSITDYAIYMLDVDGTVSSWNPGAQRFKGYAAHEIIGHNFSRFYTEADREGGLPAKALKTAATEGRYDQEGWRVRKDGSRFWAHVVIDPIRKPDGELIGFAKVTRDLSERREAELALRRSEEQFRLLVKGVTDYAIYMLDLEGNVASWNFGAQRIKGYRPEEIIGRHFSTFYTDDDRIAGLPQIGLTAALHDGRFETEGWRLRNDGSRFWAHVVIDAIPDDSGKVIGFAKVTRDVTERQAAQQALERAREALFQSQKIEAIGQLTGGVAHDFNNLLMAIMGSLELARKRLPDDPRLARLIDNAVQGAERGASLTQRMLAFARRQELRTEVVDLPALIEGMAGLLERSLGAVEIRTEFQPDLPLVLSDAAQLESALLNLAVNARDAMPGGGQILISAAAATVAEGVADLAPGDYVQLSVSDTGEGMDPETIARSTEPFFTTKGVGKGAGLGLPMVHGLAQQSGGALRLHSRPGRGTTVELWLPVAELGHAPAPPPKSETPTVSGRPVTILAVDDDALVLMNTVAMLEDLGHTVLQAECGAKALEILRHAPDVELVITDQAMPGVTGVQLAEAAQAGRPNLPVILATGYAELPPGTGVGLARLSKPFSQADLARVIQETVAAAQIPG